MHLNMANKNLLINGCKFKIFFLFFMLAFHFIVQSQNEKYTHCIVMKEGYGNDSLVIIGQSKKFVKRKYGKSDKWRMTIVKENALIEGKEDKFKRVTTEKYGTDKKMYYYNSLELLIDFGFNDSVSRIIIETDKYRTSKGLRVGDKKEKAYSLYGDGGCKVLHSRKEGIDIYFDCDIVNKIEISKPY